MGVWGRETNDRSKMLMVVFADGTKETLLSLIEQRIEKGSVIISGCGASYS